MLRPGCRYSRGAAWLFAPKIDFFYIIAPGAGSPFRAVRQKCRSQKSRIRLTGTLTSDLQIEGPSRATLLPLRSLNIFILLLVIAPQEHKRQKTPAMYLTSNI